MKTKTTIESVAVTAICCVLGVGFIASLGIEFLIGSIIEGSLFGAFIGIVMVIVGFGMIWLGNHEMHQWDYNDDDEEES